MKKVVRIIIILVVVILLGIDFFGLWKYKLNGKKYELATSTENDAAVEELPEENVVEYTDLTSETMEEDEVLFIKNIENTEDKYCVKGVVYEPYEISKDDYTSLRSGESIEILGSTYTKSQIKSNNLMLKSTDQTATGYYVNYDTTNKKYILKESKTDYVVYKSTESNVKLDVEKGTAFSVVKNGKTENKKIENVLDTHKDLEEPESETGKINTCVLTFNKNGSCTKIVETCR